MNEGYKVELESVDYETFNEVYEEYQTWSANVEDSAEEIYYDRVGRVIHIVFKRKHELVPVSKIEEMVVKEDE